METPRHQQKFLTLECEGRSRIFSTDAPLRERTLGHFLRFIFLGPGGLPLVSVLAALFNVTFQEKENKEQLGARKLTTGPAGLWREGTEEEWPGLGTPCVGHGQSGAPGPAQLVRAVGSCALAAPLRNPGQLDVSMGSAEAGRVGGQRDDRCWGAFNLRPGKRGGNPGTADLLCLG